MFKGKGKGEREGNGEGEENKAGQWLVICVSAAVEYFQPTWPGFFFHSYLEGWKMHGITVFYHRFVYTQGLFNNNVHFHGILPTPPFRGEITCMVAVVD